MQMRNKRLEAKWEARLKRDGLSMNRGNPRSRLTYVDPSKLEILAEKARRVGRSNAS